MTPQEDRLMKKVSKRNHRGETPLHCSAIKVGHNITLSTPSSHSLVSREMWPWSGNF